MSDSIDNGDGGAVGRLRRTMKPAGKVYRNDGHQLGNGDVCPLVAEHGKMYVLPSGKQYCPDQSHDKERVKTDG